MKLSTLGVEAECLRCRIWQTQQTPSRHGCEGTSKPWTSANPLIPKALLKPALLFLGWVDGLGFILAVAFLLPFFAMSFLVSGVTLSVSSTLFSMKLYSIRIILERGVIQGPG